IDFGLLLSLTIGTTLVIAGACALNNYLDQDIDQLMQRTKKRVLVTGEVSSRGALIFAVMLAVIGIGILSLWTNLLFVWVGVAGFVTYVWLYGALSKRRSIHGTLVGSISGAMPILAGYVAVSGSIDTAAVLLFIMIFAWQFPEFYSIAIYRFKEYKAAGIPLLPIVKGVKRTKVEIAIYTTVFVAATLSLTPLGYTGYIYFIVMAGLGLRWIILSARGFSTDDDDAWARKMFGFSMITILGLCVMLSVGPVLP
ncbi:MAG: heme o synthase, partial [Candidatus Saccharimonadales bacterium]